MSIAVILFIIFKAEGVWIFHACRSRKALERLRVKFKSKAGIWPRLSAKMFQIPQVEPVPLESGGGGGIDLMYDHDRDKSDCEVRRHAAPSNEQNRIVRVARMIGSIYTLPAYGASINENLKTLHP
jgi:hypothetical protein